MTEKEYCSCGKFIGGMYTFRTYLTWVRIGSLWALKTNGTTFGVTDGRKIGFLYSALSGFVL